MTADQLAAALLVERYGTTVPEHRHNEGPTLWWQQRQAVEEAWAVRKPYRLPKREAS